MQSREQSRLRQIGSIFSSAAVSVGRVRWTWGDAVALSFICAGLYFAVRLALSAPAMIQGPMISLSPAMLPVYAGLSFLRMLTAYLISLSFSLWYGSLMASNRRLEQFLLPLLDVLQSVPILSFLPVVLLGLSAFLSQNAASEFASVVLIFTSQAWNLAFGWYQAQKTLPQELSEAAANFQFSPWLRFRTVELPFGAITLVWNSVMSWAGGWFFLMAAEIFTVGNKDFRLPGLGAYLSEAANAGDVSAITWGLSTLLFMIVALDQLLWRPLLAWSDRFKLETIETDQPRPRSWFLEAWRRSRVISDWIQKLMKRVFNPLEARIERTFVFQAEREKGPQQNFWSSVFMVMGGILVAYGVYRAGVLFFQVSAGDWKLIVGGMFATGLRVFIAMIIALAWTVPAGVGIGMNSRITKWAQPLAQIAASVPATALFPVLMLGLVSLSGGLNLIAVLLMLMGTQWYLLFNIIAGVTAIPQDLRHTASALGLKGWQRWRVVLFPALFPYIITGLITASGGAWNASIVAEYTEFGGRTRSVTGIGSTIAKATATGNYPMLLAATLTMIFVVVLVNRFLWRRLYALAEDQYRMD
jgi:NitT/TauT family transport system permease protein